MPQTVYYAAAVQRLVEAGEERPVSFSVPTGNFGNVLAGYIAKRMGLPIDRLIVASNRNDILTRFLASGALEMDTVYPTHSPSMDIQVSSNLERLLFDAHERSGAAVAGLQQRFRSEGRVEVDQSAVERIREEFDGARVDDSATVEIIRNVAETTGVTIDPHTAVGVGAVRERNAAADSAVVTLATAHPAKFPEVVAEAVGHRPALPDHLRDLFERPEKMTTLANDLDVVEAFVRDIAG